MSSFSTVLKSDSKSCPEQKVTKEMKAATLMEVTGDESSTGQGTQIFYFCNEISSKEMNDESEKREESVCVISPAMNSGTLLKGFLEINDASPSSSSNHLIVPHSSKSKLEKGDETKPKWKKNMKTSDASLNFEGIQSLSCDRSPPHPGISNNVLPIVNFKNQMSDTQSAYNFNFSESCKRPNISNESIEDQYSSFIVCHIGGTVSSPKIQRIFANESKIFIKKAFQNSHVNEIKIVSGSASDEILRRILPFEQSNNSSSQINIVDANTTEPDLSSDDNFNHLIDIIEIFEDSPSPMKRKKRKVSSNACKTKQHTGHKNIQSITHTSTSDDANSCKQFRADEISTCHKNLKKEGKHLNETQTVPESVQDLNTASISIELRRFECEICHNTFCSKYSVRDHILAKHPPSDNPQENRAYKCKECPSAYVRKSALSQHIKMFHINFPKFQCPSCPKSFKRSKYLEYHTLRAHSDAKKYLCQHCGAAFSLIFALNEHVNYHHSGKTFKCNDCNKVYKKAHSLIIHSKPRLGSSKPTCRYCKETFTNKCLLQSHLRQMHEEIHQFFCQSCDAKFTQKRSLLSHMKQVHQAVKNYPCPLCDKFFKNTTGVRVHLNHTHTNERNFKCELCCRHFKTRQIYNEHMAAQHPM